MDETSNPFETAARHRKAWAISRVLIEHRATPEATAALGSPSRQIAAELAGVNPPSEATWALVVTYVSRRRHFGAA